LVDGKQATGKGDYTDRSNRVSAMNSGEQEWIKDEMNKKY